MFEEAKKYIKKTKDFDHDCHNGPDDGCQGCHSITEIIDGLEQDERELQQAFTAILQFAKDIRKNPEDTNGVVDYSSGKIIEIVNNVTKGSFRDGKNNKSKRD
jgi:hypothetical protein